jgi:hypothetical protein
MIYRSLKFDLFRMKGFKAAGPINVHREPARDRLCCLSTIYFGGQQ